MSMNYGLVNRMVDMKLLKSLESVQKIVLTGGILG